MSESDKVRGGRRGGTEPNMNEQGGDGVGSLQAGEGQDDVDNNGPRWTR